MEPNIFVCISALTVFTSLILGAYEDIKTRRAPKWIWLSSAPIALVATLLWYYQTAVYIDASLAMEAFLTSVILCPFCMFMGFRRGNGGDWRSLFYVSLLTPWFAPVAILGAGLFGVLQIGTDYIRFGKDYKSPWMVSILAGFGMSILAYLFIQWN